VHYLLVYRTAPDYLARRPQFRDAHLALAWAAAERGDLVLGGAAGEPIEGAILLFSGDSPAVAERFAQADPYVANGLVSAWRVLPWKTVVGTDATEPVKPG
jgi:hypothetical protein